MSEWIEKRLGDIAYIEMGQSPDGKYYNSERDGMIFLQGCAEFGKISPQSTVHTTSVKKVAPKGSVLFSVRAPVGKINRADQDYAIGRGIAAIIPQKIDFDYLFQLFLSRQQKGYNSQGSTFDSINSDQLNSLLVKFPADLTEQARIAYILGTVDAATAQTEALIVKYGRVRTGLMQDLLTRGIDELPMHSLGQLADVLSGITLGKKHEGPDTVERPYLRVANVQDGFLNLSEITYIRIPQSQIERYLLREGDVLMNEGGDFDKLGRGTVWQNEIPGCLHQNHVFRVRCNTDVLLPNYLALVCTSPYGKRFFVLNSKQSTNLASINSTQLKSFPIPLPDIREQKRLVKIFAQKTAVLKTHQQQLTKLQTLKRGLMQDLLSVPVSGEVNKNNKIDLVSNQM